MTGRDTKEVGRGWVLGAGSVGLVALGAVYLALRNSAMRDLAMDEVRRIAFLQNSLGLSPQGRPDV